MNQRALFFALLYELLTFPSAVGSCLPNAKPPEKNVTINGVSMPLGIWIQDWPSGQIVANIMMIIAQDVLGYNTISGLGASSIHAVRALGGCKDLAPCLYDPALDAAELRYHVSFEIWTSALSELSVWEQLRPQRAPQAFQNLGYAGEDGTFIPQSIISNGIQQSGLGLDYYRFYNASWYDPSVFFSSIDDIDTGMMLNCQNLSAETAAALPALVHWFPDDPESVSFHEGSFTVKCWRDGYWWFSPACRQFPSKCVPWLTLQYAWGSVPVMQQSITYNMPIAVGFAKDELSFYIIKASLNVLAYGWSPDATFINRGMKLVGLPDHNTEEFAAGLWITQNKAQVLSKLATKLLKAKGPDILSVVERMTISKQMIESMMLESAGGKSDYQVACDWLRSSSLWQFWLPEKTACIEGQGVIDASGSFLSSRTGAEECDWCQPGYFSFENTSDAGLRTCILCSPGHVQPQPGSSSCASCERGSASHLAGQSQCIACMPGRFAAELGQSHCQDCSAGSFAPGTKEQKCNNCTSGKYSQAPASTECIVCGIGQYQTENQATSCSACPDVTYVTFDPGATQPEECTCASGFYLNRKLGKCVDCKSLVGYTCSGGLGPPLVSHVFFAQPVGSLNGSLRNSNSFSELLVWRCTVPERCAGDHEIGKCPPHMEGYGCSVCEDGYARSLDLLSCDSCEDGGMAWLLSFIMILFPAVYVICILNRARYKPTVSIEVILIGIASVVVTFCQLVFIVVGLNPIWPSWFREFGEDFAGILMVDTSFAKTSCLEGTSFPLRLSSKLLAPIFLIIVLLFDALLVNFVTSKLLPKITPRIELPAIANAAGLIVQTLYVMTCKATFSYIECVKQPNAPATLILYPDVECGSEKHHEALPVFLFGVVVHVVGSWTYFCWINVNAMRLANNGKWRNYWRNALPFLIGKWKPSTWYWGQIYLTRNLLVSLVGVFEPNDGYFQCFLFTCFVLVPGSFTAMHHPWRHPINNYVDIFVTPLVGFIAVAATSFVTIDPTLSQESYDRGNAIVMTCLVIGLAIVSLVAPAVVLSVMCGVGPLVQEEERIDTLARALAVQAKAIDKINDVSAGSLRKFIANLEPSERTLVQRVCLLTDIVLTKGIVKTTLRKASTSSLGDSQQRLMRIDFDVGDFDHRSIEEAANSTSQSTKVMTECDQDNGFKVPEPPHLPEETTDSKDETDSMVKCGQENMEADARCLIALTKAKPDVVMLLL